MITRSGYGRKPVSSGNGKESLHLEIPILILLSAVSLGFGLVLPVLTLKQFILFKNTFSVLTGIEALYREGSRALAVIVFCFSILFPILKLFLMLVVWVLGTFRRLRLGAIIGLLGHLGKWSMLDVFVVAFTVVVAKISHFMDAKAQTGIYVFTLSIVLAMLASIRLEYLNRATGPGPAGRSQR